MTIGSPITPFKYYTSTPLYDGCPGITSMIKVGVINKYSQVCKKKEKKTKQNKTKQKTSGFVVIPPPQGFPKLFINNWFPSCISAQMAGNRRSGTDLIRSNKKGLRHGRFCSFQCFKIWPDCLNFKHWPILSSASGALLIFTVKSTLNYTRVLTAIKKKKKKKSINYTQIRRRCMRHLIRTYAVWELIYQIWDRQTVLIKTKKKRKKTGAFKRCILLSLSVKRPLISWTAPGCLQSQCIHTCHTNGLIIRLPLLMIRINRLFTAQRSVKCWFFDNVWIMT